MAERKKKKATKAKATKAKANAKAKAKPAPAKRKRRSKGADAESIVVAVAKGRVLREIAACFAKAGVDPKTLLSEARTLVRHDAATGIDFLLLKPDDVPTYVEYGAADLGVVGRDVLMERNYDLYAPLDLGIGRCRLVVAGVPNSPPPSRPLRVATKFTEIARQHFLARGQQVTLVYVQSSVELAPLTGLADLIVDLVQTGETLQQNGLVEIETISEISSLLVANRVALKLKRERIGKLLAAMGD